MINFIKKYNTVLILLSVVLAIIYGVYFPHIFTSINFIGEIFINLLKLFALPLIASALITVTGSMGDNLKQLRRIARSVLFYMILSEIIAVTIALLLFNLFKPGVGVNPALILNGQPYVSHEVKALTIANFLSSIIPSNIFNSLANFDLLPVAVFSIMFGVGCALSGEVGKPVVRLFSSVRDVANNCLYGVMLLAPFAIFVLVGSGVATANLQGNLASDLGALINFVLVLFLGLVIHALWQMLLVIVLGKKNTKAVLSYSLPVFSTAFATSSSVATIPAAIECADNLASKPAVTRFMLPLCASINIGGMMMYEVAAALFFSQVLGLHLPLSQQILVAVACILGGMAEGGIPETSLVSMVVVFKIVNVPLSAISILLPLDRIIDRFRTMVNIFGNMCGAVVVSVFIKNTKTS